MSSSPCFICNGSKKKRKKNTTTGSKLSSNSCPALDAISKLWGLCFDKFEVAYKELLNFCRGCSKKVKRICLALEQLESLRQVLFKLKLEIEETVKSTLVTVGSANLGKENEPLDFLRKQIVKALPEGSKTHMESDVCVPVAATVINNSAKKSEELVQNDQLVVEDPHWRETFGTLACESSGESEELCGPLNEPKSICNLKESENSSSMSRLTSASCFEARDNAEDEEFLVFLSGTDRAVDDQYNSNRLRCPKCHYTFKDEVGKDAHMKKIHEGNEYPYVCTDCKKHFKTRRQLQIHDMGHKNESPFTCEHCGKGFRAQKLLGFHLKNKHTIVRDFKCGLCEKAFITRAKLKIHETSHSKVYPIKCSICGKGFTDKTSLSIHMVKHAEVNPWQCQNCEKLFSCSSALNAHKASHTNEYKFKCSVCASGAPSQSAMDRHMLSHSSEKAFACNICSNTFKYQRSLQKHLKAHAGEKSFQCSLCGKTFIDKYKLVRHTKIHEGNKPYECQLCQKRFYTKDYLTTHMKYHEKQATKQEGLLKLKKAKRAKRRKKIKKKVNEPSNFDLVIPQTIPSSKMIRSLANEDLVNPDPILHPITSPDIFSGVFEFTYQDL